MEKRPDPVDSLTDKHPWVGTSSAIMGRDSTTGQKEDVTVQRWEELITTLKPYASNVNTL